MITAVTYHDKSSRIKEIFGFDNFQWFEETPAQVLQRIADLFSKVDQTKLIMFSFNCVYLHGKLKDHLDLDFHCDYLIFIDCRTLED